MRNVINVGDLVTIKGSSSQYNGEWGRVVYIDDYYHVALWDSKKSALVFDRKEIRKK